MNTIDAAAYLTTRIADIAKKYPANSISRREIVSTLPLNSANYEDFEKYAAEIDRTVTATIYKSAADMWDKMPDLSNFTAWNPFKMDPSRDAQLAYQAELTANVQQAVLGIID
jgi:hypothetical protein